MINYEDVKKKLDLENRLSLILQDEVSDVSLIPLHNEVCEANYDWGSYIECMDYFGDHFCDVNVLDFLDKYNIEEFNTNDNYYIIDDNNIISFDYPDDYIDCDEISAMILNDYKYYLNNCSISEITDFIESNYEDIESIYE